MAVVFMLLMKTHALWIGCYNTALDNGLQISLSDPIFKYAVYIFSGVTNHMAVLCQSCAGNHKRSIILYSYQKYMEFRLLHILGSTV